MFPKAKQRSKKGLDLLMRCLICQWKAFPENERKAPYPIILPIPAYAQQFQVFKKDVSIQMDSTCILKPQELVCMRIEDTIQPGIPHCGRKTLIQLRNGAFCYQPQVSRKMQISYKGLLMLEEKT